MRENLRRRRRKLEKRGSVSVDIRKGELATSDFLQEFLTLEAAGWKGRLGTAITNNSDLTAFYTTLVENCSARGQLEWHGIRVGNRLVAGQLGIRCGASLVLPKFAFDEEFSDCSPGHLLTEEVFKEAFLDAELVEINTMSSADHHRLWHMPTDEYADLTFIRRSVIPILVYLPQVKAKSLYQTHLKSYVPQSLKNIYRYLKAREHSISSRKRDVRNSEQ